MLSGNEKKNLSRRKETVMKKASITLYLNDPMGKR